MKKSDSISNLSKSMTALQGEVHDGIRDQKGGHGKYADLAQLLQIIRPLLAKHKLSFSQHPSVDGANISLTSLLAHESGEWIESTLLLAIPASRNGNVSQAIGSGITYARRYALSSIFGISQEDDDGNYGHKHVEESVSRATESKPLSAEQLVRIIGQAHANKKFNTARDCYEPLADEQKREVWKMLPAETKRWMMENKNG